MPVFALTIFTGAFLLFQVQPLIGKYILPWFGGGPGVWTTCMLFFQALLLGGYAYAHFTSRRLRPRTQAVVHLGLLLAALALLPITPSDAWKPQGGENPTLQILALLTASLGLPYFVLSSTGPLMQQWFSRTNPGRSPYRLYALSNVGSLLALVTYPLLFESYLTRRTQAAVWAWGLAAYAVCCAFCAVRVWKSEIQSQKAGVRSQNPESSNTQPATRNTQHSAVPSSRFDVPPSPPSTLNQLLWLLLPACASVLLLATTNKLCQDITVIPFLWVLPLALYLLSFIICFDNPRWYARFPFTLALIAAFGGLCWAIFQGSDWPLWKLVAVYSGGLFVCCMVCHGELYRLRPDPRRLTGFYLMIAAGGALGGLFVAVAAPLLFTGYYELHWGLFVCGLLFLLVCVTDVKHARDWHTPAGVLLAVGVAALGAVLWLGGEKSPSTVFTLRNFYGVLRVSEDCIQEPKRHIFGLMHGRIWHGWQFVDPVQARWPTLYYSEQSGIGLALRALPAGRRRIGVGGLGIGTLAAYAQPGDYLRFYEINPEVQRIAASRFSCLAQCLGKVEVAPGDARLSLEKEPPQRFDLLALDAFSSDAIPAHLLTTESFKVYAHHLKTNGVIAVHISNPYLDLEPVLVNVARHFNYRLAVIETIPSPDQWWLLPSLWVLLTHDPAILDSPAIRDAARPEETGSERVPLWTDDFTSVFQILKSGAGPQLDPGAAEADLGIATRLGEQGDVAGAIAHYRLALQTRPNLVVALNNLAWLLATAPDAAVRNGPEAVQLAEQACRLTRYCVPCLVGTLAAAYAEAGRFPEAIAMAQKACARASISSNRALLEKNQQLLELYRRGQPYHEPAAAGRPEPELPKP